MQRSRRPRFFEKRGRSCCFKIVKKRALRQRLYDQFPATFFNWYCHHRNYGDLVVIKLCMRDWSLGIFCLSTFVLAIIDLAPIVQMSNIGSFKKTY